ncbi:hypothetical protein Tco_0359365 [Tanacetum coccineum]
MLLNVDQLQKQLDKDEFQEYGSMAAFWVVNNQFQKFIDSQFTLDYDSQMTDNYFVEYTGIEVKQFRDTLLQLMGNVKKSVSERTQSSGTELKVQDDNSRSGNDIDADDADIRPIYDEEPMAEVQLTAECNIFAIGQQHTEQPEIINEGQHSQILNETSNKAKIKKEIDVLETMNIELEHSVAKLRKENETLKKHYKDLYDSIKITRSKTIEQTTSLLANNVDLKAQIQEKRNLGIVQEQPRFSSNDMVHNHYLDEARKRHKKEIGTQKLIKLLKRVTAMPQQSDHSRVLDLSHIPNNCCMFYNVLRSLQRHKLFSPKKSPNKTSTVYEKTSPRSDLRWKPTGRICKSIGLRWIPTGKLFDSCTSKDDSEPTHGSNVDIPNIHESKQTLDLSAGTSINVQKEQSLDLSASTLCNVNKENLKLWLQKKLIS